MRPPPAADLPLAATTAACGAAFGLGLARYLFELAPARLAWLGDWPGTLLVAGACATLALGLPGWRRPALEGHPLARWAPLALALPLAHALLPGVDPLRGLTLLAGSLALFAIFYLAGPQEVWPRACSSSVHGRPLPSALRRPARPSTGRWTVSRPRAARELSDGGGPTTGGPPRLAPLGAGRGQAPPLQSAVNEIGRRSSVHESIGAVRSGLAAFARRHALSGLLFLTLLGLYVRTLAPAVGEADTFEFQVGIARLGVAHGSGYPLLMLLGRLFVSLPVGGTLAFRANLTSAFFGAIAGLTAAALARRLGAGRLAALLAGFTFGVSPTLWSRAVEVEAYTLNAAFVGIILCLCLDLAAEGRPTSRPGSPPQEHLPPASTRSVQPPASRFALLGLLTGLSLTNHLTTLLLLPACGLALIAPLWRSLSSLGPRAPAAPSSSAPLRSTWPLKPFVHRLSSFVLFTFLGLLIYLYIPLRWPAVNHGQSISLAQFTAILEGGEARGAFQWRLPFTDPGRYGIVFSKVAAEYGALGLALAALGLLWLIWRALTPQHPAMQPAAEQASPLPAAHLPLTTYYSLSPLLVLIITYLAYTYFALAFNVPDPDFSAFLIPLHLLAAALLGAGAQALLNLVHQRASSFQPPASVILISLSFTLPLASLWRTLPRVDQSQDWAKQRLGEYILSLPLAPGSTILADSDKIAPLYYLQAAEGRRPDLDIIVLPDEASYVTALDERLAAGGVVYLGRYLPGLASAYSLRSVGPLAEVSPSPTLTAPGEMTALPGQASAAGIRLIGFSASASPAAPPDTLPVTLVWQAPATPDAHLLVYLRLRDQSGALAWQSTGAVPAGGLYPTNAWRPDEIVTDYHGVPILPLLAPGRYALEAGLFPSFEPGTDGWMPVMNLEVRAAAEAPRPEHLLRARVGPHWLLGYDAPESAAPASRVPVTLYWESGQVSTVEAFGVTRSTAAFPAGRAAPIAYHLAAPALSGPWQPVVGAGQATRCGWLAAPSQGCPLPPINILGPALDANAVVYDGQLALNRAELETAAARPGEVVNVRLEWIGLRTMAEDYTVFVHLLGPDGRVHGQVDTWPVSGTRATSDWAPGRTIVDPYAVRVDADAPPGNYLVEIGLYLLEAGQRLPVLNSEGQPVDDKYLLPGLEIEGP